MLAASISRGRPATPLLASMGLLLWAPTAVQGYAVNMTDRYCNRPMKIGIHMMSGPAYPAKPDAVISVARNNVTLGPQELVYYPNETLHISIPRSIIGQIAWEASGGAEFLIQPGCKGTRSSNKNFTTLRMPTDGSTVDIWAGWCKGFVAVAITPNITLKPAAGTAITVKPKPIFSALFTATLANMNAANFDVLLARGLINRALGLSISQVYIAAKPAPLARRLLARFLQSTTSTDMTIRLTNLPEQTSADSLVISGGNYLTSTLAGGFAQQYMDAAFIPVKPVLTILSSSAPTFTAIPLAAGSCVIDEKRGMGISWQIDPNLNYVDIQLEGEGQGWISGGLVSEDKLMVTTPPHKVLIYDYRRGDSQFVAMLGYEAVDLVAINASTYGVTPLLMQGAGGKLFFRYRQSLADAAVPVDLAGTSDFMWAWADLPYPIIHDAYGTIMLNWAEGTCTVPTVPPAIEGYWLLFLPFLGLLVTYSCLNKTQEDDFGKTLLQRRLGAIPRLPRWLDALTCGTIPAFLNLKWGELLMIGLYYVLLTVLIVYWSVREGGLGDKPTGIAFGKAALTTLMMTYLPVSKTTLWVKVFGISFERAVKFHRHLSWLGLILMTVHLILLERLYPLWDLVPTPNGIVIAYGLLAYLSFLAMSLTALVRRWLFGLFRYVHYLYIAGTVFMILHVPEAWQYLIVPCLLHVVDVAIRWVMVLRSQKVAKLSVFPDQITQLDVFAKGTTASSRSHFGFDGAAGPTGDKWAKPLEPGAYVFVCIPKLSLLQWHPISISTAGAPVLGNTAPLFSLHIKSVGKGQWTDKLYQLAAAGPTTSQPGSSPQLDLGATQELPPASPLSKSSTPLAITVEGLTVMVDGPYGKLSLNLGNYSKLVLVAGGIGLTPMTSVLSYVIHQKKISKLFELASLTLVWAVRNEEIFNGFAPFLEQTLAELNTEDRALFQVQVYVTGKDSGKAAETTKSKDGSNARVIDGGEGGAAGALQTLYGRPDIATVLNRLAVDAETTGVLACAPKAFVEDVQRECVRRDVDLHMEEFAW